MATTLDYDAIIVGSGFGGAMTAHALAAAGQRVAVLERGGRVGRRPAAWAASGTLDLGPFNPPVARRAGGAGRNEHVRATACVGGGSVFFGGVSLRFRERDFDGDPAIGFGASAAWPYGYEELEPYYDRAERLLDVAGTAGADPLDPPRSGPYPQPAPALSPVSERIAEAARTVGLRPFPLPLAINFREDARRPACARCSTCDTYACAIAAKNDVAATLLADPPPGVTVLPGTSVRRLRAERGRVRAAECVGPDGTVRSLRASRYFLAAGALGTPLLLLASGLHERNPAGESVGRYLVRHCSSIVMGVFPRGFGGEPGFHKQIGVHDLYFGDREGEWPGKLGSLQQIGHPPVGLIARELPPGLKAAADPLRTRLTGLLAMAEDQPSPHNRVRLGGSGSGGSGLTPAGVVEHRHTRRDLAARARLVRAAGEVLSAAGAAYLHVHPIDTFSHALGTVRMGADPRTAPVDPGGRFRGVENLHVVDGSALPTAAAVNPSLTIAACALRAAEHALALEGGSREHALVAA